MSPALTGRPLSHQGSPHNSFFFFFNFIWMAWPHRSGYLHFENSRRGAFMKTQQIWQNWVRIPTWHWAEASSLRLHSLVSCVPPMKSPGLGAPATDVRCPCYRAAHGQDRSSEEVKRNAQRTAGSFCPDEFRTITLQTINFTPHAGGGCHRLFSTELEQCHNTSQNINAIKAFSSSSKTPYHFLSFSN